MRPWKWAGRRGPVRPDRRCSPARQAMTRIVATSQRLMCTDAAHASRAVSDCSLRSLRCSLGCRRLRRIWRNGKALFRHLLLQIGGANIEDPTSSSFFADDKRVRSSLLRSSGARFALSDGSPLRCGFAPGQPPCSSSLADGRTCPLAPPHDGGARNASLAACVLMLLAHRARWIRRRRRSSRTTSVSAHRSSDRRARDLPTPAACIDAKTAVRRG